MSSRAMPPIFCADLCRNHGRSRQTAMDMIAGCGQALADIVKFQSDDGLGFDVHREMIKEIKKLGMMAAVTVRTPEDVAAYKDLVYYLKIGSGECLSPRIISAVRGSGKPWIISTGGTSLDEYTACLRQAETDLAIICECVSSYPQQDYECRLGFFSRIGYVRKGWSDHMPNIHMALAAIALGAVYIEKHITPLPSSKRDLGGNHDSSVSYRQFGDLVLEGRAIYEALSNIRKDVLPREHSTGKLVEYRRRAARQNILEAV